MPSELHIVRDFVLQIEKTLNARRLYRPGTSSYREASERLHERCRTAAGDTGFVLRVGPNDLFLEKTPLLNREKTDEAYFFPLYRDGLRELRFTPDVTAADLESLLGVFETTDRNLGAADDMVGYLWRQSMTTIKFVASDGIGDLEAGLEVGQSDLTVKIAELSAALHSATGAETHARAIPDGQAVKLEEDARAMRAAIEQNASVLTVPQAQLDAIRAEFSTNRADALSERFIEILTVLMQRESALVNPGVIASILGQLAEGFWSNHDFAKYIALVVHLRRFSEQLRGTPAFAAIGDVVADLGKSDRVLSMIAEIETGNLAPNALPRLFDIGSDVEVWPMLAAQVTRVPEGELRSALVTLLRAKATASPELAAAGLRSTDPAVVRGTLGILDEALEQACARDLFAIGSHPDESVRLRVLGIAARVGGPAALDVLWRAIESDPSKSVRLFAFRTASNANIPGMVDRLRTLVSSAAFAERPAWEREKYVRLLGSLAGAAVEPLFESWIPAKKWMWQTKDLENLELAFRGLIATGESGRAKVETIADGSGKPADVAKSVLDSTAKAEMGQTVMNRRIPTAPGNVRVDGSQDPGKKNGE